MEIYLQLQEIVGTIISTFMRNLCPLDVSTNSSSDMFGDMYVWSSDRNNRIITIAPVIVTAIIKILTIYKKIINDVLDV